ncbi:hypothetical protein [Candidatus Sororendozoicomonas aggregata]|uniref:hypothetical protein n=1 Tax=Candidatus Sororendozoicomonas aggregata TaxID=3073239 RepID=UPI002ED0BB91
MNYILRVRKSMANKSFVFFTGILSLSIMGNAYSRNTTLSIRNIISPIDMSYSAKGYTISPGKKGKCMLGVYNPREHTALYGKRYGHIRIHYNSAGECAFRDSYQKFNVINNDTGKVVGKFAWEKRTGDKAFIDMLVNPYNFMVDVTDEMNKPDKLNLRCEKFDAAKNAG